MENLRKKHLKLGWWHLHLNLTVFKLLNLVGGLKKGQK